MSLTFTTLNGRIDEGGGENDTGNREKTSKNHGDHDRWFDRCFDHPKTLVDWLDTAPKNMIPPELSYYLMPTPHALGEFSLVDLDLKKFDLSRLTNRWSIFFFGYSNCPDICPTALGDLNAVYETLKDRPKVMADTQWIFVTVDPKRDLPSNLKEYLSYFNSDFQGLIGSQSQILDFVSRFKTMYRIMPPDENGDYAVLHPTSFLLVDPKGHAVTHIFRLENFFADINLFVWFNP